ncbi:MAG: hypothetical protein V7637_971 [Mycobacteriales bacterium]
MEAGAEIVEFRVLGPFEVECGGRLLELGGPRLRAVLALLVAGAGRVVSLAALVDGVWAEQPPPDADRTMRSYVSRLRGALTPPAERAGPGGQAGRLLVTRPPGYLLRPDPDAVDAGRFEQLAAQGRQALAAGRHAAAARELTTALTLWRGDPYAEFGDVTALRAERGRLEHLRLTVLEDRIEADLSRGLGSGLVAELEALTGQHPGHERLWAHLMTALYQAGRQAAALEAFARARAGLVEQAGLEPSPTLIEIHRRVLAQDPGLLGAPATAAAGGGTARPAQLPPTVPSFAGRHSELAALDAALPAPGSPPAAAAICAVSGTAGVGKTALVVRWAHRVADRFPDGQLYLNLRGFDPDGQPVAVGEAVRGFLDALGVPAERVPVSVDAQVGLYRGTVAGKRILVILDNARDAEQARPLLPGTATAMAVVTSRDRLIPLVAADGARPVILDVLPPAQAGELFGRRLAADRLAAEPAAAAQIIAGCGGLPLALAIAAARAATNPHLPLAALAGELSQARDRLDALSGGDPGSDVRAVFSWSYQALSPPAARLFALLGLYPGPDIAAPAVASLAGTAKPEARRLLAELTRASLLTEHTPGRYAYHDLLHAYAADLAQGADLAPDRAGAVERLLDHYLHTAHAANQLLDRARDPSPLPLGPPAPGTAPDRLTDRQHAMPWLSIEHPALLGALRLAADSGFDTHAWQLAWALSTFLDRQGHWHDLVSSWHTALAAAERLDHPTAQACAHHFVARAYALLGDLDKAHSHLERGLRRYVQAGDRIGEANVHLGLAYLVERLDRPTEALDHARRAFDCYLASGHRRGQANALNTIGWYHTQLGDHAHAVTECQRALTLFQEDGDRDGEAATWDTLGYAHHHLAQFAEAIDSYRHALDLFRDLGDRYYEADTLAHLGDTHQAAGDHTATRETWQQALAILTALNHPDADHLHTRLNAHAATRA